MSVLVWKRNTLMLTVIGLCALTAGSVSAQIGHSPQSSPYRDIRKGHTFTVVGGYFGGEGTSLNIGPHDGVVYGARYDIRTGGTIQFGLGVAYGTLQRFIVDPYVPEPDRKTGPVDQSVTFIDLSLQFNVTGGKSWHRIAPFIGATLGLALASETPADTSGFDFGSEFYFAPAIGTRVFLSDRLHVRAEARATFWKLDFPLTFQREPTPENPNPVIITSVRSEWDTSSWLQVGVGYSFSP
jgi:hypothetical protein